jgi:hypothetical protein
VEHIGPPPTEDPHAGTPGRFAVLHDAAEALLDDLADCYMVERRETKEPLRPESGAPLVRVVRLIPRSPAAGPLAVAFTDSPGIVLRLGRWYEDHLPACGGDARDEDPAELVANLRAHVAAHVEGGLWERVRRGVTGSWRETRLVGPGFSIGSSALLEAAEARSARREGFAAAVRWAPWPRRGPLDVGTPLLAPGPWISRSPPDGRGRRAG